MTIEIPVTNYVFKYLVHTYGEPPYHLAYSRQNDLRLALEYMSLRGEPVLSKSPARMVRLELGDNHMLAKIAKSYPDILATGTFFLHEFFQAMRAWVFAQEDLATQLGLSMSQWNRQSAIKVWLEKHNISEDDYSLSSAYRQFLRKKTLPDRFFSEKIRQKFDFLGTGSKHFRLCTYAEDEGPKVSMPKGEAVHLPAARFFAWSRSKEKLIRCRYYIPHKQLHANTHLDYYYQASEVINHYLLTGHSVA